MHIPAVPAAGRVGSRAKLPPANRMPTEACVKRFQRRMCWTSLRSPKQVESLAPDRCYGGHGSGEAVSGTSPGEDLMTSILQKTRTGAASSAADASHRKRWWILAVLGVAQLMVVLDATVVTIA